MFKAVKSFCQAHHLYAQFEITPVQGAVYGEPIEYKSKEYSFDFTNNLRIFNKFLDDNPKIKAQFDNADKGTKWEVYFDGAKLGDQTEKIYDKHIADFYAKNEKDAEEKLSQIRDRLFGHYDGWLEAKQLDGDGWSGTRVSLRLRAPTINRPSESANDNKETKFFMRYERIVKGHGYRGKTERKEVESVIFDPSIATVDQAVKKAKGLFDNRGWSGKIEIYSTTDKIPSFSNAKLEKSFDYTAPKSAAKLAADKRKKAEQESILMRSNDFKTFEVGKSYVASTYLDVRTFPILKLISRTPKTGKFEVSQYNEKHIVTLKIDQTSQSAESVWYDKYYHATAKDLYNGEKQHK